MPIKSRSHQSHHQKTAALLISRQPVCLSSTNPWRAASHSNVCEEKKKKKKSAISALWIFHAVLQSRVAADRLSDVTSARSLRENSICSDNLSVTSWAFKELSPLSTSYYNSLKFSLNHRTRQHRTALFFNFFCIPFMFEFDKFIRAFLLKPENAAVVSGWFHVFTNVTRDPTNFVNSNKTPNNPGARTAWNAKEMHTNQELCTTFLYKFQRASEWILTFWPFLGFTG